MDDAELVGAARTGDASALAAIFDRHAGPVHDLALAMLRDRQAALDVVDATFREASHRLGDLAEEHRLSVWLLALARRQAALRAGPAVGTDGQPSMPDDDPPLVHLVGLVWEAVGALPLPDRTLLDLELRHGLLGRDLADALGVPQRDAEDLQAHLRGHVEKALTAHLVAHTTDERCPELTRTLLGWDGRFDPEDPRRIGDHVTGCRVCTQTAAELPPPFSLYATVPPAPGPFGVSIRPKLVLKVLPSSAPEQDAPPEAASSASPAAAPPESQPVGSPGPGPAATAAAAATLHVWEPGTPVAGKPAAPRPAASAHRPTPTADHTAGAAAPVGDGSGPWTPDGFPPPSFRLEPRRTDRAASGRRRSSRRLVVAALLGAVLLVAAAVLVATRDDDETALSTSATATSAVLDTTTLPLVPSLPLAPIDDPAAPVVPAVTTPGSPAPGAPVTPSSAPAPGPPAGAGVLVLTFDAVRLPRVDSTEGPQSGPLPLRNTGRSALSYTTRSSFAGLTVDKPTGTIEPGATTQLTVTLDGTKAGEGEFTGTLIFEGSGGTRQIGVAATVGRPPALVDDAGEECPTDTGSCSRLIQLVPPPVPDLQPSPCNTPWRYSVTVNDESLLKRVRADANQANRDAELRRDGAPSGPSGRWQSDVFPPLPAGAAFSFTIEAVDQFDYFRRRTVRTIEC